MRRWLPFLLYSLFILIVIVGADLDLLGAVVRLIHGVPGFDKIAHAALIGTLAWFLNQALRGREVTFARRRWLLGSLGIGIFFTLEECSQAWVPGRSFDLGDLAANWIGAWLAGWLFRRITSARPRLNSHVAAPSSAGRM